MYRSLADKPNKTEVPENAEGVDIDASLEEDHL